MNVLSLNRAIVCVAGGTREGGLVWRGCSAGFDAEDGAARALADGDVNPGDKVTTIYHN